MTRVYHNDNNSDEPVPEFTDSSFGMAGPSQLTPFGLASPYRQSDLEFAAQISSMMQQHQQTSQQLQQQTSPALQDYDLQVAPRSMPEYDRRLSRQPILQTAFDEAYTTVAPAIETGSPPVVQSPHVFPAEPSFNAINSAHRASVPEVGRVQMPSTHAESMHSYTTLSTPMPHQEPLLGFANAPIQSPPPFPVVSGQFSPFTPTSTSLYPTALPNPGSNAFSPHISPPGTMEFRPPPMQSMISGPSTNLSHHVPRGPTSGDNFMPPFRPGENAPLARFERTSVLQSEAARHQSGNMLSNTFHTYGSHMRATLQINGDLNVVDQGWTDEEKAEGRRLVEWSRYQRGNQITASFRPLAHGQNPERFCISCVWWAEKQGYYVTSVDAILLLQVLVGVFMNVQEKNRIRRNLEGYKPTTINKTKPEHDAFFKMLMGYPMPRPRNIEKDIKVFPWRTLGPGLIKIIGKYSATWGPDPNDGEVPRVIPQSITGPVDLMQYSVPPPNYQPAAVGQHVPPTNYVVPSSTYAAGPSYYTADANRQQHQQYQQQQQQQQQQVVQHHQHDDQQQQQQLVQRHQHDHQQRQQLVQQHQHDPQQQLVQLSQFDNAEQQLVQHQQGAGPSSYGPDPAFWPANQMGDGSGGNGQ